MITDEEPADRIWPETVTRDSDAILELPMIRPPLAARIID